MKPAADSLAIRILYLFAGESRHADMGAAFRKLAHDNSALNLEIVEMDILRGGKDHDLLRPQLRAEILKDIQVGKWEIVMAAPPCSTFYMATFSGDEGPKTLPRQTVALGIPMVGQGRQGENRQGQ